MRDRTMSSFGSIASRSPGSGQQQARDIERESSTAAHLAKYVVQSTILLCLMPASSSARAEGALGGLWLLVVAAFPLIVVGVPIWIVVRWVRSGRSDSHKRFKEEEATKSPVGRLGE